MDTSEIMRTSNQIHLEQGKDVKRTVWQRLPPTRPQNYQNGAWNKRSTVPLQSVQAALSQKVQRPYDSSCYVLGRWESVTFSDVFQTLVFPEACML